ncbi:MAG: fasciclin domain-containing protein [Acidimicrobiales bacterium]
MKHLARTTLVAAAALALPFTAVACSSDDDKADSTTTEAQATTAPTDDAQATEDPSSMDEPFGAACDAVPADGAGSFDGMAQDPVATAASNNPVLSTLVAAVSEAGLVDTLNNADDITVFAPTDDAFAAVDPDTLDAAMADPKGLLTDVLQNHVVAGRLTPEDLAGDHETLGGGTITVTGSGEDFTVDGSASVVCGNVQTANATVYIIDGVLLPA